MLFSDMLIYLKIFECPYCSKQATTLWSIHTIFDGFFFTKICRQCGKRVKLNFWKYFFIMFIPITLTYEIFTYCFEMIDNFWAIPEGLKWIPIVFTIKFFFLDYVSGNLLRIRVIEKITSG